MKNKNRREGNEGVNGKRENERRGEERSAGDVGVSMESEVARSMLGSERESEREGEKERL